MFEERALIAAVNRQGVIGIDGKIPWVSKADMRFFRLKTLNSAVIMGRKTYESIGRPLKNRIKIVISSTLAQPRTPGIIVVRSMAEAIYAAMSYDHERIYAIGGTRIYKDAVNIGHFDTAYITDVDWWPIDESFTVGRDDVAYFPFNFACKDSKFVRRAQMPFMVDNESINVNIYSRRYFP